MDADLMKYVGYAAVVASALAVTPGAVVKVAHAMGYELPVLTKAADGLEKLAGVLTYRPEVYVRRAKNAK